MRRLRVIEVDEEEYTENDIRKMSPDQLKMFISFIEKEKELRFVQNIIEYDNIKSYIDNLLMNIDHLSEKYKPINNGKTKD